MCRVHERRVGRPRTRRHRRRPIRRCRSTATTLPDQSSEPDQAILTRVPGVLTVGTEQLAAPWYIGSTPDTVTSGFEYDVAKALASRLHVPAVRVVLRPLVTLLSGDDCGCDLMLSEVLVTDARARDADLTEPYLTVDQAVLVRQGVTMSTVDEGRAYRWGVALEQLCRPRRDQHAHQTGGAA